MIELSNSAAQTIAVGSAVTFDTKILKTGCAESYRQNAITLKNGIYEISFSGNISGATANTAVSVAIAVNGVALPETTMAATPSAADEVNNVSASTLYQSGCNTVVTVVNTGTTAVTVAANSAILVRRVA